MMNSETIKSHYANHVMTTYSPSLALVKGHGTRVWDADGMVYLDFGSGISVLNVGHTHPMVVEKIKAQAECLMHTSNLYYNPKQGELAAALAGLWRGAKCFFCNSGAEANEGLYKMARLWGHDQGRYEIITMKNSFHGRTLAGIAATGQDKVKKGFEPETPGFKHAEFNNLSSVAGLITDKTVAIQVEAVQGEGGVVPATEEFISGLRVLCDKHNLLLLFDEVQCGLGRTGEWFGFQNYGVEPDAFSLAKALGGGFPIGAVLAGPKLANVFKPGHHASTFGGNPLACTAALATISALTLERLPARSKKAGAAFKTRLLTLVDKYEHVVEVRGKGLMLGIVLDQPSKPAVDRMAEMGLLTLATAGNVIRLLPPLNVKDSELEEAFEIMDEVLAELHGMNNDDDAAEQASDKTGTQSNVEEAIGQR